MLRHTVDPFIFPGHHAFPLYCQYWSLSSVCCDRWRFWRERWMDSLYALRQQQVTCYIPRDQQTAYASPSCNLLLLTSLLRLSHSLNICFSRLVYKNEIRLQFLISLVVFICDSWKYTFLRIVWNFFPLFYTLESNLCLLQNISVIENQGSM